MTRRWVLAYSVVLLLSGSAASAQQDFSKVEVTSEKIAEGVYMLKGAGGNIGLSVGADTAFLIDDQYAPLTPKVKAAVAALTSKPVRFVLNTHWHGDHTGGNKDLGESGTLIVAHENVRKRMSTDQFVEAFGMKEPAADPAALPVVTFTDAVTFHLNGGEIYAFHVAPAHTDGDSIVQFRKANVIHGGDTFFNGMYPFIDLSSGGSVNGMIAAAESHARAGRRRHEDHPWPRSPGHQGGPRGLPRHAGHRARPRRGAGEGGQDPRAGHGREADGGPRREVGAGLHQARPLGVDPLQGPEPPGRPVTKGT